MQFTKITKILTLTVSLIALNACTHMNKKNPDGTSGVDSSSGSTQTAGLGNGNRYNGTNDLNSNTIAKNTYYFDFDRSEIRASDKPALYAQADYLLAHPNAKILLEGHTDPRGSREYNVGLGERRANSIAELLKTRGVNPDQIRVLSYGAERLAANGRSEQDFQLDRRSVVVKIQG